MQINRWNANQSADSIVVLLTEEDSLNLPQIPSISEGLREIIAALSSRKDFTGKKGSLLRVPMLEGTLYLSGLGKSAKCTLNVIRDALVKALRTAGRNHAKSSFVPMKHLEREGLGFVFGEAAGLCGYVFDKYKAKGEDYEPFALEEVYTDIDDSDGFRKGQIFAESQIFARELINEPGCAICPETLAVKAKAVADECGLACEVWDEERLSAEGMGGILAVGSGSKNPPRLIHLTYRPEGKPTKRVAFVGKGITFDSGGLNIKPDSYMRTMKGDKTGACNVLAILRAVAALKPDVEIHGFMTCAENMPSGSAYKPDDIITARNGKTIEIDNTDAEGRLVLADALCVASELKPDVIVDMATLTGACAVALGQYRAGLFVNDDELAAKILECSEDRGEPLWRMPLEDEHIAESLKSECADLVNCGKRYGGAIFAAMFLKEFVGEGIAWAHMDIAGPDTAEKEYSVYSKGMTAFGVRTCLEYVMSL